MKNSDESITCVNNNDKCIFGSIEEPKYCESMNLNIYHEESQKRKLFVNLLLKFSVP